MEKTNLVDTWKSQRRKPIYTHITHHSTSRIDRIYIAKDLAPEITRTEVIVAPFTDHDAFAVHINLRGTHMDRGPSYWKLNTSVICDKCTKNDFVLQWGRRRRYKANFPPATLWWELVIKPRIRSFFFKRASAKNRKEEGHTAEFLYSCINELILKGTLTTKE
jgi:hypothetical protein